MTHDTTHQPHTAYRGARGPEMRLSDGSVIGLEMNHRGETVMLTLKTGRGTQAIRVSAPDIKALRNFFHDDIEPKSWPFETTPA